MLPNVLHRRITPWNLQRTTSAYYALDSTTYYSVYYALDSTTYYIGPIRFRFVCHPKCYIGTTRFGLYDVLLGTTRFGLYNVLYRRIMFQVRMPPNVLHRRITLWTLQRITRCNTFQVRTPPDVLYSAQVRTPPDVLHRRTMFQVRTLPDVLHRRNMP